MSLAPARTDRLLLANAIMGQFLTGVATRIFIVSLPTLAVALDTDILAISWALIVYELAGISLSVVFGRLGDMHGRYAIYGLGFAIMTVSFVLDGKRYTVCYLSHPQNPGQTRWSERDYGRFGNYFEYELSKERPLHVQYRIWLQAGEMTGDQVQALYRAFVEPLKVVVK